MCGDQQQQLTGPMLLVTAGCPAYLSGMGTSVAPGSLVSCSGGKLRASLNARSSARDLPSSERIQSTGVWAFL
jgi:hypothetical protein